MVEGVGDDRQQLLGSPILFVFFLTSLIEYRGLDTHTQYTIEQISVKVKVSRLGCVCERGSEGAEGFPSVYGVSYDREVRGGCDWSGLNTLRCLALSMVIFWVCGYKRVFDDYVFDQRLIGGVV